MIILENKGNRALGKLVLSNPIAWVAFGFGAGLLRPGPGTWGTLVAFPLHYLLSDFFVPDVLLLFWLSIFFFGIKISSMTAHIVGQKDHSGIVIDEIVGFGVVLACLPSELFTQVVAFAIFRIYDILKPFGIRTIDKHLKGGLGVMLDDLVAGVYCLITIFVLSSLVPDFGWEL